MKSLCPRIRSMRELRLQRSALRCKQHFTESCSARWDHQSWISVTCTPRDAGGKKGTEFVLIRGNNGTWNRFGR